MRNLLVGNTIRLTAVKDNDLAVMEEWFNNADFLRYYDMVPAMPRTGKQLQSMLNDFDKSNERIMFAIRHNETEKIIGVTGFDEIIWSNGSATLFIGIGENGFTGRGIGKEAMQLVLDFGFYELNFHRIQLNVISYNEIAIRLYESLGFIREGTYRDFILRDGKRFDMYLYGMLNSEWSN